MNRRGLLKGLLGLPVVAASTKLLPDSAQAVTPLEADPVVFAVQTGRIRNKSGSMVMDFDKGIFSIDNRIDSDKSYLKVAGE